MADIEYDFAADASAAERAIARLEQKTERLENQLKQNARTSRRGASQFQSDALGMVSGLVSVSAAVAVVSRAYQGFTQSIEKAQQASATFNQTLLTELTLAGDLAEGTGVRKRLESVPGATREQATAAFAGVTGGAPDLDVGRRLDLAVDVSRLAPLLSKFDAEGKIVDTSELKNLGNVAAKFAEQAPGLSADDATDLALSASESAGSRLSQLQSPGFQRAMTLMQQSGTSIERSMAIGLEAIQEGVDASSLVSVIAKAQEKGVTLDQLIASPELQQATLQGRQRTAVGILEAGDIDKLQRTFEAARRDNLVGQRLRQGLATDPVAFRQQQTAVDEQRNFRAIGDDERARLTLQRANEAQFRPGSAGRVFTEFGGFVENQATAFSRLFTDRGEGIAQNVVAAQADRQVELLEENNRLMQEQLAEQRKANAPQPPRNVNRQAHTE